MPYPRRRHHRLLTFTSSSSPVLFVPWLVLLCAERALKNAAAHERGKQDTGPADPSTCAPNPHVWELDGEEKRPRTAKPPLAASVASAAPPLRLEALGTRYQDGRYGQCVHCGQPLAIPGLGQSYCVSCGRWVPPVLDTDPELGDGDTLSVPKPRRSRSKKT
ncbi:hypothetical protein CDCA_CDCA14G3899 [Cyanidium caldarium]|uniref:Uncharacterized protein n=1 Tax=Cyanidium caldarium TaxID=2771 RepID=A0AAV9J0M2_CYACA|nr:hypothetical protein CDCA_CDCA14G3899 [Cyanidium caldarium]